MNAILFYSILRRYAYVFTWKGFEQCVDTFLKSNQNLKQETAESETGMAEKSRLDQANSRQKPGLVWRNRKKISQIIKDYFYLPFFLLIILCYHPKKTADKLVSAETTFLIILCPCI